MSSKIRKNAAARPPAARRAEKEPPAATPPTDPAAEKRRRRYLFWLGFRLAIPVVGVIFLGWPQMMAALLYVFECWLFVVSRTAADQLLRKRYQREFREFSTFGLILRSVLGVGFVTAMFGGVSIAFLIDHFFLKEWEEFAVRGWRDPLFLISLGLVFFQQAQDLRQFAAAWRKGRTLEQKRFNELEKASRLGALIACNFLVLIGGATGFGGAFQVIAMSALMFWIESAQGWKPFLRQTPGEEVPARERAEQFD